MYYNIHREESMTQWRLYPCGCVMREIQHGNTWGPDAVEWCAVGEESPDQHLAVLHNTAYTVVSTPCMHRLLFERWLYRSGRYDDIERCGEKGVLANAATIR